MKRTVIFASILVMLFLLGISLPFPDATLPGMPALENQHNIYSAANVNKYAPVTHTALNRVYVPNSMEGTVSVIDPSLYRVVDKYKTGKNPQHVVPAYNLKKLWVLNDTGYSVTPINVVTGKPQKNIPVDDPYNMYFTPDGRYAIVVDEAKKRFDFRDPETMAYISSVPVACRGLNHMDFTADGRTAIATCEFSGQLVKLDVTSHRILNYLNLTLSTSTQKSMPQDIRLSPDGKIFYVADMSFNGVFLIDPEAFRILKFIPTGIGTHSIYPSRDGKYLYVANRGCNSMRYCPKGGAGSITVVDPQEQKAIANWPIPGGGSPDMGNITGDGKELWLSGRYDKEVYVFDTQKGILTHRIPVGRGPHGLTVWPQPGRYSLGHTGNMR